MQPEACYTDVYTETLNAQASVSLPVTAAVNPSVDLASDRSVTDSRDNHLLSVNSVISQSALCTCLSDLADENYHSLPVRDDCKIEDIRSQVLEQDQDNVVQLPEERKAIRSNWVVKYKPVKNKARFTGMQTRGNKKWAGRLRIVGEKSPKYKGVSVFPTAVEN